MQTCSTLLTSRLPVSAAHRDAVSAFFLKKKKKKEPVKEYAASETWRECVCVCVCVCVCE